MKITPQAIPGVVLLEPKVFGDERGFFVELFHDRRYREAGLTLPFVQDNLSYSKKGVLRGLHFQKPYSQGKLVTVLEGSVFDVAVDIRRGSPTFGKSVSVTLDGRSKAQFYIPPGFAHGFLVTSETALFSYKCTDLYHPECEGSVLWDDPDLNIDWPLQATGAPQLSDKDRRGIRLKDIDPSTLPVYTETFNPSEGTRG